MTTFNRNLLHLFVLSLALAVPRVHVQASETLAAWVPDQSGAPISDTNPVPGSTVTTNLSVSPLFQAGGVGLSNTTVWPVSVAAPRNNARYLEFAVAPSGGRRLSLNSVIYSARSYLDSDLRLHLRSSLDAFGGDLGSATTASSGFRDSLLTFDFGTVPVLIDAGVTFRLYPDKVGGANDFLDLRGDGGVGLQLVGEIARRLNFSDAQFYSFSDELVGGFELPALARHIRFLGMNNGRMQLQNQFSGDARVLCLNGQKDFFATSLLDAASVNEQFPICINLDPADLPSDVSIWKLPDGRLFRFQMLQFSVTSGPGPISVSGTFQAGPLQPLRIFASDFED